MRIIKEIKLPEKPIETEITCRSCKSILAYTNKDIVSGQHGDLVVICPVCKSYLDV